MSYVMVNEDLRVQSCSIEDLSQGTKDLFTEKFNGDNITTLTFFYNPANDTVILNHDSKYYELYKLTVITCLEDNEDKRELIRELAKELLSGSEYEKSIGLLDQIVKKRKRSIEEKKAKEIKKIIDQQPMDNYIKHIDTLEALRRVDKTWKEPGHTSFYDYNAFMYGYIQGIRSERAKRNRRKRREC